MSSDQAETSRVASLRRAKKTSSYWAYKQPAELLEKPRGGSQLLITGQAEQSIPLGRASKIKNK